MAGKHEYKPCAESDVPGNVRFDTPRRWQGQLVERAYGGWSRAEHDVGDPWKRVTDHTTGAVSYFRLIDGKG